MTLREMCQFVLQKERLSEKHNLDWLESFAREIRNEALEEAANYFVERTDQRWTLKAVSEHIMALKDIAEQNKD